MSAKWFCDCCGIELTSENKCYSEGKTRLQKIQKDSSKYPSIEIITGKGSTWNAGDWCRYCVIDTIIREFDNRPTDNRPTPG